MKWTAILLAGERPGENHFALDNGVTTKALIPVGGEPMLGRVARTLLSAPSVERIVVLAQDPGALLAGELGWMAQEPRIRTARGGAGISNSILDLAGTEAAPWPVLIATADHVLLTPAVIEEFLAQAEASDAAFGVVERRVVEAAYPQTSRTWLRFSDGDYTGANLFALRSAASQKAVKVWAEVEHDRKKAMRIIMFFGPLLALRARTRTISFDKALATAAGRLGITVKAVRLSQADAAIDVDKQADLELVEQILARRNAT
jgi:GTP:adenosylcobinamide-phosphate guanylyltransferase